MRDGNYTHIFCVPIVHLEKCHSRHADRHTDKCNDTYKVDAVAVLKITLKQMKLSF